MKHHLIALAASLASALAPALAHAQVPKIRAAVPGYQTAVSLDSVATNVDILASRGALFAATSGVFEELKIPIDTRDSLQGIVGISRTDKMRSFAGMRMSQILDCGAGMTGLNADNWRIYMTVYAFVEGKEDKSKLHVAFVAGAKDVEGASKDAVSCGSTGAFESMFADRVKKRLFK